MNRSRSSLALLLCCLTQVACQGILDGPAEAVGSDGPPGSSPGDGVGEGDPDAPVGLDGLDTVDPSTLSDGVPAASRVVRLSYGEFNRTLSDLLGSQIDATQYFPAEQPNLGPYENGGERGVNERLLAEMRTLAETLAGETVADATRFSAVVGCETKDDVCRDAFLQGFGQRAYRRPLTTEELARLQALFASGAELVASGDGFRDGVELVLEAVLQSAKLLYRVEQGAGESDEAGAKLTGFEVATRLSYLFWGTTPDPVLLTAAGQGELDTAAGIATHAQRLALDQRTREQVLEFHDRWLELSALSGAEKDPVVFPAFSPALAGSMRAETRGFVEEVTLTRGGGISQLLTTPVGFVDAPLAALYGLPGTFGTEPSLVEFTPEQGRRGLLTQAAFLTGHSSASTRTSPILRGVFVLRRLLCEEIPPPPAGAEMEEPDVPSATALLTTRQYFEWKTSMTACNSCHSLINPAGFAFENFDAIGQRRETENTAPIDPAGVMTVADSEIAFATGAEFIDQLAALGRVRACYATNWMKHAFGRAETTGDSRTLGKVTQGLLTDAYGVRELLVTLTSGAAFNHLPPKVD